MKQDSDIVLSVLDLAAVREGGTVAESFRNTLKLAQQAEKWGYRRFWLAEHHNIVGIASAATSVLIGHCFHSMLGWFIRFSLSSVAAKPQRSSTVPNRARRTAALGIHWARPQQDGAGGLCRSASARRSWTATS
jgi:Luciferase-like monooxygenase